MQPMQRLWEVAMDETMRATIETLKAKVEAKSKELAELRRTVNFLSKEAGGEPIYPEETLLTESGGLAGIRPDEFYGKSPITAAREYLEKRGRAVPAEEILEALDRGGFDFDAQGWGKKDRLRSLAISLSKNTSIFHKLPNGTYGLAKFYPEIKTEKKKRGAPSEESVETASVGEEEGEE